MAPIPGDKQEPENTKDDIADVDTPPANIEVESDNSDGEALTVNMGYQLLPQDATGKQI